jgi:hypothetical protein
MSKGTQTNGQRKKVRWLQKENKMVLAAIARWVKRDESSKWKKEQ